MDDVAGSEPLIIGKTLVGKILVGLRRRRSSHWPGVGGLVALSALLVSAESPVPAQPPEPDEGDAVPPAAAMAVPELATLLERLRAGGRLEPATVFVPTISLPLLKPAGIAFPKLHAEAIRCTAPSWFLRINAKVSSSFPILLFRAAICGEPFALSAAECGRYVAVCMMIEPMRAFPSQGRFTVLPTVWHGDTRGSFQAKAGNTPSS